MSFLHAKQKFTFGLIGAFAYSDEIAIIEKLIITFAKKEQPVHFLIIGDGVLLPTLKKNLKQAGITEQFATFTSTITREQYLEYLGKCDAYLCPTQPNKDGADFFDSPAKLFEYMSMAKPIITSNLEQLGQIISPAVKISGQQTLVPLVVNNEVGVLVDPLDIQGFFNACRFCCVLSPEMRQKMGQNARQKVLNKHALKKHLRK